jgi:2'-5' RNA ligase
MKKTLRTFIAVKIQPKPKLITLIDDLKKEFSGEKIKWVEASKLHLTLKFLGDTTNDQVEIVKRCLKSVSEEHKEFQFDIAGLGFFKNKGIPRVLYARIINSDELITLAGSVENKLEKVGFKKELRNFKPHLTLGRIKYLNDKSGFYEVVNEKKDIEIQTTLISELFFYSSALRPQGPVYEPIEIFKLFSVPPEANH